jgi:elongation factor G
MQGYPPGRVRNVALVGHGGSGKTTLAEALLHHTGAVGRMGRVEDGTTVCDTEPEEVKRHLSLSLAVAPIELSCGGQPFKINLLDTPGYLDFVADVHAALRVADLAVFVVSAVEGVEVGTETAWRLAEQLGVPRMVFVNKLDRERASFERTLDQLREVFGAGVAPLELPVGTESGFRGVADLLTDRAYLYDGGAVTEAEVPEDMADLEHQVHDNLVEGIVVADDALMERYLDGDVPSFEELEHVLADGLLGAQVFPVVCGSATLGIGVDRLAQYLCEIGPAPAADPEGEPEAFVFRTVTDPYVGRISLFKVVAGTIRPDSVLRNHRTGTDEKLHSIFALRGKEHLDVDVVHAGDIAAVAKLGGTLTGDVLGGDLDVAPLVLPEPALTIAVRAATQADEDKLATALQRMQEEDPALRVRHDEETHQTLLDGMGETHLNVAIERMQRKFGVTLLTEEVRVPYRETITAHAEAEGKHKKQSGGHGQFGVADIRVDPLPRGSGFQFVDAVVGGAIPRQFIPAVEKGIQEAMEHGGVHGFPVVDVKVELYDGKFHSVDSSEMSFKTAGALAFREAVAKASPVVLEPVSHLEVDVPESLQGDVMGDLNSRRGRVLGSWSDGSGRCTVEAEVPTSELRRYAIDLRSLSGGRGTFRSRHERYDPVPPNLVDRLVGSTA